MDLRVKPQPKEILFIQCTISGRNAWNRSIMVDGARHYCGGSQRGTSGNAGDEPGDSGCDCLDGFQILQSGNRQSTLARDAKRALRLYFSIETRASVPARQQANSGEISWDKLVK